MGSDLHSGLEKAVRLCPEGWHAFLIRTLEGPARLVLPHHYFTEAEEMEPYRFYLHSVV